MSSPHTKLVARHSYYFYCRQLSLDRLPIFHGAINLTFNDIIPWQVLSANQKKEHPAVNHSLARFPSCNQYSSPPTSEMRSAPAVGSNKCQLVQIGGRCCRLA
jgi:hypothetical protein